MKDKPALPLIVLDLPQCIQAFFRDALNELEQPRHTVLDTGQLLQGAEVGQPAIYTTAMHFCHLHVQCIQQNIL